MTTTRSPLMAPQSLNTSQAFSSTSPHPTPILRHTCIAGCYTCANISRLEELPIITNLEKPNSIGEMAVRQKSVVALPNLIRSLRKEFPKASPNHPLPSLRRAFSLYDQINLIDNVPDDQLRFQGYTDTGFTVNGVQYEGSLLCVGNLLLSWSPKNFSEITPKSLSIFQIMRPIPEILILGSGRYIEPVDSELKQFIRSTGMKLEAIDSRNAASTYNILNEEGRIVAAALLPYGVSS